MSNRKCCVPGCLNSLDTHTNLHKFPNPTKDKELFNTWVYSVGGDILQLENEYIFKYRRVCRVHFEEKYWCRNNRLSKEAVPTTNMPGLSFSKGGACTSLAPGGLVVNAAGTSAGGGLAVAKTTTKTKPKSVFKQRKSALIGTSTDPSNTQATTNTTAGPTLSTRTTETLTPRGEHKRLRLDHSKRVEHRSYAQAASATLDVAITCDRTGILSKDVSDQVLAAIQKQIILEACSPKQDTPGPTFNAKPLFAGGVLKLWCGNDHTLAWLKKTVSGLTLATSASLVVLSQSEVQKRARCGVVIPDEQGVYEEPTNIGRALSYQNPWVDIKKWVLLHADKLATAWFVVVGVPVDQIPTLMEAGRRLSILLGAVYVKFQGRNGRFTDIPQGWDPATGTICEAQRQLPLASTGESTPPGNNPDASAAEPASAESATPVAATVGAGPSSDEELDDMILSPASGPGGDGFDEGDLFAGLRLRDDDEGLISDGVPFVDL